MLLLALMLLLLDANVYASSSCRPRGSVNELFEEPQREENSHGKVFQFGRFHTFR
jgi:hypothetical protein